MWKGENGLYRHYDSSMTLLKFSPLLQSEYQLVAGGEELFQENGLLAHKSDLSRVALSDVRVEEDQEDVQSPFAPRTPSDSSAFPSEGEMSSLEPPRPIC